VINMREIPEIVYFNCPECDDITVHDVLKGKMGKATLDATLKCQDCGRVFSTVVEIPRVITTKIVVSEGRNSEPTTIDLESDDLLVVGDEFLLDDGRRVRINALELNDGRRVKKAQAPDISTIWSILFDVLNVKVSINDVQKTYARYVRSEPDDEFYVGQTLSFRDMDCLIHSIKIKERMIRRGTAEARDIVRIYGKLRKKSYPVLEFDSDEFEFDENDLEPEE